MTLSAYEAEVSLAVRISKSDVKTASPLISNTNVDLEDENMDVDTTLISFGFEYVDATRKVSSRLRSESDSSDGELFTLSLHVSIDRKTYYSRPLRCSKPPPRT